MADLDKIQEVVTRTATQMEYLHKRLYGEVHDPGDIPAIRKLVEKHETRLSVVEKRWWWMLGLMGVGGGGGGIVGKLLGLY